MHSQYICGGENVAARWIGLVDDDQAIGTDSGRGAPSVDHGGFSSWTVLACLADRMLVEGQPVALHSAVRFCRSALGAPWARVTHFIFLSLVIANEILPPLSCDDLPS